MRQGNVRQTEAGPHRLLDQHWKHPFSSVKRKTCSKSFKKFSILKVYSLFHALIRLNPRGKGICLIMIVEQDFHGDMLTAWTHAMTVEMEKNG